MLANNPYFMWVFISMFIWAGGIAIYLSILKTFEKNYVFRILFVVFGVMALESAFWLLFGGVKVVFGDAGSFAKLFHWLFSTRAIYFWIISFISMIATSVCEYRDTKKKDEKTTATFTTFVVITAVLMAIYWFVMFLGFLVNLVVSYPI